MRIGILGSGVVAKTVGGKLAELGHAVRLGSRDPGKLKDWLETARGDVAADTFAKAAAHGELVINATNGAGSLPALQAAGAGNLEGKVLIDISNPLDFSKGMPPSFFISNTDSLGEQIQKAFPGAKVVKALNTVTAALMVDPGSLADGDHHLFLGGNDADAKARVARYLKEWFGWKHIVDLGDITNARGTEMYLALWVRLWGALGTHLFNVKVVR